MNQVTRSLEIEIIHELQRAFSAIQEIGALLVPRKPHHRCGLLRTRKARGKARTRHRQAERRFQRQRRDLGPARVYMLFSQAHWEHVWREFERTHDVHMNQVG